MKFQSFVKPKSTIEATQFSIQQLIKLNSLLSKFTRSHNYNNALQLFTQIHSSHYLKPDHYSLSSTLTACANLRYVVAGNQLHCYAIRTGFKACSHVGNTLLSLYAKSEYLASVELVFSEISYPDVYSWTTVLSAFTKMGRIDHALCLFDKMPTKNVELWNAIITGCAEIGHAETAFDLFRRMHVSCVRHDNYTFASVLSLCNDKLIDFGKQIHLLVIKTGLLFRTSVVNSLLTMYFNCGDVRDACSMFEESETDLCAHDQITFNAMIAGLASVDREEDAFVMFRNMQEACLKPTELTFVSVMSSCSYLRVGLQAHAQAIKIGFGDCTSVSNAAITMYTNCKDLQSCEKVFERLEEKDLVSWNTIIASYAQACLGESAILAYLEMQREGIEPDEFTIGSLLMSSEFIETVSTIQALVSKNGLILKTQVSNALISAHSKHGNIKEAYQLFDCTSQKSLISWNTIMCGLLLNGFPLLGLDLFSAMLISKVMPNPYTLSIVLSICASISALQHGKQVHTYILKFALCSITALGNALITLYAKCGVLDWSLRVFNKMTEKDTVSWNALISSYSQHGKGNEAVQCFKKMQTSKPDEATFTAVISACSHAGLVDEGLQIFNSMVNSYGFVPKIDHFSCIVDLLGRAGYLDLAEGLFNCKYLESHPHILWTLLSSCTAHENLKLGKVVAGFLLEIEKNNASVHVLLSNINAAAAQWEEAARVRVMQGTETVKQPALSWISV